MIAGALEFARQAPWVSALCLVLWVAANAVCTWLWTRRDRIPPFPAMMVMLLVGMSCALTVVVALDFGGSDPVLFNLVWEGGRVVAGDHRRWEIRSGYRTILLLFPALIAYFSLTEGVARKSRARTAAVGRPERSDGP
jgi:hypothetical protein